MDTRFVANKWVIFVTSVLVTIVDFGVLFSLGAMFVPLLNKFRASRSATALVQSLMMGMIGLGVISGVSISKFGLRKVSFVGSLLTAFGFMFAFFATSIFQLYFLISIIAGFGIINVFICATVAVSVVFDGRNKSTAVAVQMVGIGIGATAYPYILMYLTETYGVNGTYLILGAFYLNNFCVVILYGELEKKKKTETESSGSNPEKYRIESKDRDKRLICMKCRSLLINFKKSAKTIFSWPYVLNLMATALAQCSLDGYIMVFVDVYIWKGHTESQGNGSALSYQICSTLCRILGGLLVQIKGFDSFVIPIIGTILGCVGIVVIYFSKSYIVAHVGSALLGVAGGGVGSGFGVVVAELVPGEQFGTAYGLVCTAISIFSIIIGPVYGEIRDVTQSYALAMLVIGIVFLASSGLYLTGLVVRRLSRTRVTLTCDISAA